MKLTKILGAQAGIQSSGVKDNSEADTTVQLFNAIIFGQFKRGRFDKPFKVTLENIRAKLGYDPDNKSYIAVEDTLRMGAAYIWVQRLINKTNPTIPDVPDVPDVPEPPKDEHVLQPFDYAVIRYIWTEEGGADLDTRTAIISPPRNQIVGWGKQTADENFLVWSGDNTGSGVESVLLDMKALKTNYPTQKLFEIEFKAFWYATKLSGRFQLQVETYKNGEMVQDGYNFINEGGITLQTMLMDATVDPSHDHEGYVFAHLALDLNKNTGSLVKSNTPHVALYLNSSMGTIIFEGPLRDLNLLNSGGNLIYLGSNNEPLRLKNSSNQTIFESNT